MFDTKTEQFQEWKLTARWASPYDVILDKNENAWTGSMITDQVTRLDTKTGEIVVLFAAEVHKHPPRFCRQYDNAG